MDPNSEGWKAIPERTELLRTTHDLPMQATSLAAVPLLRYGDASRRGQQHGGDESLLLQPQHHFPHLLDLRTGIMDQHKSARGNLRQEMSQLLFPNQEMAVAEENINCAVDLRF
jgi:hypothetical protein